MKRLKEVPSGALQAIQTEHQKAIEALGENKAVANIPIRKVKMRIDRPTKDRPELETVIVPETNIYYNNRNGIEDGSYRRNQLSFRIANDNSPFPFGHIFSSSGSVCLGSIFVPSKISIHNPAQPLEALFLHNDHNINHGGANLKVDTQTYNKISKLLIDEGITLSRDATQTFKPDVNLIRNDGIWIVSADVADQLSNTKALFTMTLIFDMIFSNKQK